MNPNTWSGAFSAQQRGERNWVISAADPAAGEPARVDVHLIGVALEPRLVPATFERIEIAWTAGAADVALRRGAATVSLRARAAFVHQERPRLYADLPLEVFGPRSRTFWRRVFFVVKVPGGRILLNYIARRARA
jgi:hypothetical protein